ncbi:MAG TPA: hypothetical protein VGM26_10250 [Rhizomicrobium sp.]|jgi:hypothetical protein
MSNLSNTEKDLHLATIERIHDDRVRYFYLMLGDAIANLHTDGEESRAKVEESVRL